MVQLRLPANSRITQGRTWNERREGGRWTELRVYRWHPDENDRPRLDTYWIDMDRCGPMVLDALFKIKNEIDPTLAFRRSCREGICGSCSMNMNGDNGLACLEPLEKFAGRVTVYPLPHMHVIRDLVPDLGHFFRQYHAMQPWLQTKEPEPEQEWLQTPEDRDRLNGLYECILCACCSAACPSYWWNEARFLGPAVLLQAARWVEDSRDQTTDERLDRVSEPMGAYGCRQILNCAKVCPKGLNPAEAIAMLRRRLVERQSG